MPEKGTRPKDIPGRPDSAYKDQGWVSMGDWLGTGIVAPRLRKYRPFEEARKFARSLGLKSSLEWREYSKGEMPEKGTRPKDIPGKPDSAYKDQGWISLGDWLGTGTIAPKYRKWRPFEEAREFARRLGLKSGTEWRKYYKGEMPEKGTRPDDIPSAPERPYKDKGWISYGDWLGTGTIAPEYRKWRPFEEAREFVRSLGLKSGTEWNKLAKGELPGMGTRPEDIPSTPQEVYKGKGWVNWGDWLGTGRKRRSRTN